MNPSTRGLVLRAIAVVAALSLLLAAPASASGQHHPRTAQQGGKLVIAAEEELATADWIDAAAGVSWGNWELGIHTLPQAFAVNPDGTYSPGPVLAGEPTLDPGPPIKVTYPINPAANWSDGQPITSKDFEYLWKQITTGKNISDTTGYDKIQSIDTSDPKNAVVTFSEPYAAWRDLFGGFYFLLPSHLLEGKNRNKEMKNGYSFSGGPWMLKGGKNGWKKGKSITLVPNPNYWGEKPRIGEVTFQFIPDSAAETKAIVTNQVSAAYPQPQIGVLKEFDKESSLTYQVNLGNQYEVLWLNTAKPPLEDKNVRQALAYATDRRAIVDNVLMPSVRKGDVLQSFNVPTFRDFFSPAFSGYTHDLDKVNQLMTQGGWKKNSKGIWQKNGKVARLEVSTTAGNQVREQAEQLLQSQWKQAGFDLKTKNTQPDVLFGNWAPKGTLQIGMFAAVGTPDPGLCGLFCSQSIPNKKNGFAGRNVTRLASSALDQTWQGVDRELDVTRRADLVRQGESVLADEVPAIPLFQLPTLFVWDKSKIDGPLQDNPTNGPFYNMNLWTLKG